MGTTKKPAPRRKRPATGKGKPAVKVQAPRPRKKRSDSGTKVADLLKPPTEVIVNGKTRAKWDGQRWVEVEQPEHVVLPPVPAEEIERRSEDVRAAVSRLSADEPGHIDYPDRAGDIALAVLWIIIVLAVIAGLARSAV